MATGLKKKKPYAKTLLYGAATAILYAAVFSHSDAILQLFTRGGIYAALPIANGLRLFLCPRNICTQPLVLAGHRSSHQAPCTAAYGSGASAGSATSGSLTFESLAIHLHQSGRTLECTT